MPLIEWKDDYRTGSPAVDHEHERLVGLINSLHDNLDSASADDVKAFLGEIHDVISSHFALEEKKMSDSGYAEYWPHKDEHEHLLDDIREIMDNYDQGRYATFERELARHLDEWFSNHFRTMDRRLHGQIA